MKNRVREERLRQKMTMQQLADLAGLSRTALQRVETGETLSVRHLEALATALGVAVSDLLGEPPHGLDEDAAPYAPEGEQPLSVRMLAPHQSFWRATSNVLDRAGIRGGDVVVVTVARERVEAPRIGDMVLAQQDDPESGEAITILRQFVPPSLLVPNTYGAAPPMLDTAKDGVRIVAVVDYIFRIANRP